MRYFCYLLFQYCHFDCLLVSFGSVERYSGTTDKLPIPSQNIASLANCKQKQIKFCCSYDELSEVIYINSLCSKATQFFKAEQERRRRSFLLISGRWSENYLTNCFIIGQKMISAYCINRLKTLGPWQTTRDNGTGVSTMNDSPLTGKNGAK